MNGNTCSSTANLIPLSEIRNLLQGSGIERRDTDRGDGILTFTPFDNFNVYLIEQGISSPVRDVTICVYKESIRVIHIHLTLTVIDHILRNEYISSISSDDERARLRFALSYILKDTSIDDLLVGRLSDDELQEILSNVDSFNDESPSWILQLKEIKYHNIPLSDVEQVVDFIMAALRQRFWVYAAVFVMNAEAVASSSRNEKNKYKRAVDYISGTLGYTRSGSVIGGEMD